MLTPNMSKLFQDSLNGNPSAADKWSRSLDSITTSNDTAVKIQSLQEEIIKLNLILADLDTPPAKKAQPYICNLNVYLN